MTTPTSQMLAGRIALDLTHVLYDESSLSSLALALLTLSPILLNPAYAVLIVYTRELLFIEMYAGQLLCEVCNWFLKHAVREDRPVEELGSGYGFPSSHSQWMGYFAAFLICHFIFRHRLVSTGSPALDFARHAILYVGLLMWAGAVAYSRFYLSYHTGQQVIWGLSFGASFGVGYYALAEFIPSIYPQSLLGRAKVALLDNPVLMWFRVRDGWSVWADGGTEVQWLHWKTEWDRLRSEGRDAKKGQ